MNLIYFTRDAYKLLKRDLEINTEHYHNSDAWLSSYFSSQGVDEFFKTSAIVVPSVSPVFTGDDNETKNKDDLINVKMLYSAYKDKISPLQASDPLLWSALCHITFKEYVLLRWKKDGSISISQRFFATEAKASLTYYNAISRLWWSGYLTYDEQNQSNPWHLTEVLFSAQQIQKDLFDQPFSMNRKVVKGLLLALREIQNEKGNACTTIFRQCCDSYLNHYGAVSILDTLSEEDVYDIALKYMKSIG